MQLVIERENIYNDNIQYALCIIHSHIDVQTAKIIHYFEVTERFFKQKRMECKFNIFKWYLSRFFIIFTNLTRHEYE